MTNDSVRDKPTNPKDILATNKAPIHFWPLTATIWGALAFACGAFKYGRSNWRHSGVRASVYYDAMMRHIGAWFEGEWSDPESDLPHLAHVLACAAIVLDAKAAGKLVEDVQYPGGAIGVMREADVHVERMREQYADRPYPVHYDARGPFHELDPEAEPIEGLEEIMREGVA